MKSGLAGRLLTWVPVFFLILAGCGMEESMVHRGRGPAGESSVLVGVSAPLQKGISDQTLADHGMEVLWTKQPTVTEGRILSAYLLPEGIFAVTRPTVGKYRGSYFLVRYSLETGLTEWYYELNERLDYPPAAYTYERGSSPDELFILQKDEIRCLDLRYGAEMWRVQLHFPISCGPVADEKNYYLGSFDRRIYCMPKKTIIPNWTYITGGEIKASAAFGDSGQVYVASTDKAVVRLEQTGGWIPGKSWRKATGGRLLGSPVFFSRWVFVGSTDYKLYAYEVDGTLAWAFPAESPISETPVVMSFRPDKPMVFCISLEWQRDQKKRIGWAVDARTGKEVWHRDHVDQFVAIGRKAVYLIPDTAPGRDSGERRLTAVDALEGTELFSLPLEGFDIIPTNDAQHGANTKARGVIYLISKTGFMQAIREKP